MLWTVTFTKATQKFRKSIVKVVREFFAHKLFKYFEIRGSMLIGL